MLSEKQKAVASAEATTQNYNELCESYRKPTPKSSVNLKEKIGTLLLALQTHLTQNQQKEYWTLFESSLSQYLDLKIYGGQQL